MKLIPYLLVLAFIWGLYRLFKNRSKAPERQEPTIALREDIDVKLESPLSAAPAKAAPALVIDPPVSEQPRLRGATRVSSLPPAVDYSEYESPAWQRSGKPLSF
ncbi:MULTISPECIES: hypothetical protein [Pseudomonas]|uniref:hypothetical protein n=1 Tax=Pseudomonas TaxID=286 RepID=UPI0008ACB5A0|nr:MULTISPECIES: hypothetical protein [Pseudomonas]NMY91904.1 hypothetical protein [Pseudomonas psychrotolerans]NMY92757.1 hypothetical protein [Pseudomonas psychrotolerans]UUW74291.1 hypothetical protein NRG74_23370 [Pseudomonas psychrotolerans]SEP43700.1 hypothetical protein SAMN02787149_1148 [Pseudomonas sp. Snoq117.2]